MNIEKVFSILKLDWLCKWKLFEQSTSYTVTQIYMNAFIKDMDLQTKLHKGILLISSLSE